MTNYRLFPATNGPSTATSYGGNFIAGIAFATKGGGNWFNGYYWWVAPTGQSTSPVKCALWSVTQASTGYVVPGSVVTSGTLTAGAWNFIPLTNPIQLAASFDYNASINGSAYVAAIGVNGNFPNTPNQFNASGDPYGSGITNGPLFAYSGQWQASTKPPFSVQGNGLYSIGGSDPSTTMPNLVDSTGDGGTNFWVDVQISNTAPSGYTGTYRIYPNKFDANPNTQGDAAYNYTIATEISLTQSCALNNFWYFSPAGATTLATRCDIWSVASGQPMVTVTSPSWTDYTNTAFTAGTHQSGSLGTWIKTAAGGIVLPAGDYRVSVYNSNGSTDANWSAKEIASDYWGQTFHGVGYLGITNGPLTAPGWSSASSGYVYGGSGSNTPPWSSGGTTIAHAQPAFYEGSAGQTGVVGFPQLYAAVGASNNQSQNYWVDLEVTPVTSYTLFNQPATPPSFGSPNDKNAYTLGVEFQVSANATLDGMWFYSASPATLLPSTIALYQTTTGGAGTLITSNVANWTGLVASGWVYAAFTSPPAVTTGNSYYGCVFLGVATSYWYGSSANYWTTGGPGASGITSGLLFAPNNASAYNGQDAFFAGTTLTMPSSNFQSTNYWVDPQISVASTVTNISVSDYAGQVEAPGIIVLVPVSDVAGLVEAVAVPTIGVNVNDYIAMAENITGTITLSVSDVAGGVGFFTRPSIMANSLAPTLVLMAAAYQGAT